MKRVALVVGINRYLCLSKIKGEKQHLTKAAAEADRVADLLRDYGDFEVYRLPVMEGMQQIDPKGGVKKKDLGEAILQLLAPQGQTIPETALFYFAGHGWQKQENGQSEGYLLTSDSRIDRPDRDRWGLSLQWLRKVLEVSKVRQQIVWLDCCHSGELFNFADTDLVTFFEKKQDRCFIAASREFEEAIGGVLTPTLLEGLDPNNSSEGWVTNVSFAAFLEQALKNAPQHPIIRNPGGEILLTGKQGIKGNICPYKGLAYFDFNEKDPQYFYGRAALTQELLEKVRSRSFLAVLGMSGSGKSSVVRAGLLYQLKQGAIPGSPQWTIYTPFTPGEHPLSSFKQAVGVEIGQFEAVIKAAATERVIVAIDQFEEVFTLCREDRERQLFFQGLLGAVERLQGKLCVVVVMRADFFGKCAEKAYGGFAKAIEQNLVTVLPMSEGELKEAIVNPAEKVGLEIDRELVTQMIDDVSGSPGNLPLMQYTLTQLWDEKKLNRLMLTDYTRLGGVKKALENHANGVYESLSSEEEKKVAKRIFLELTRLGKGTEHTRRQVRQEDLIPSPQLREVVEEIIQKLANAKLLVTGEEEIAGKRVAVVNITHEALIRNWGKLEQWLKDNQTALLQKQEIEDVAEEWRNKGKGKDKNYLLQGTRLAAAENYQQWFGESVPLSSLAQEFVRRSVQHRQNSRRTLVSTVIGIIVVLSGATIFANIQRLEAETQTAIAVARERAATSKNLLLTEPTDGLVLAIQATGESYKKLRYVPTVVLSSLYDAVNTAKEKNIITAEHFRNYTNPTYIHDVQISSDERIILVKSDRGSSIIDDDLKDNLYIFQNSSDVHLIDDGRRFVYQQNYKNENNYLMCNINLHNNLADRIQCKEIQKKYFETLLLESTAKKKTEKILISQFQFLKNRKIYDRDGYEYFLKKINNEILITEENNEGVVKFWDIKEYEIDRVQPLDSNSPWIEPEPPFMSMQEGKNQISGDGNFFLKQVESGTWQIFDDQNHPLTDFFSMPYSNGYNSLMGSSAIISKHGKYVFMNNLYYAARICSLWIRKNKKMDLLIEFTRDLENVHTYCFAEFSSDEKIVAIRMGNIIELIDLETMKSNDFRLPLEHDDVNSISFRDDKKYIIITSKNKILIVDMQGNVISTIESDKHKLKRAFFSPDGQQVIGQDTEDKFWLWQWGNWQDWLKIGCNRIRYHPNLTENARKVCEKYIWKNQE